MCNYFTSIKAYETSITGVLDGITNFLPHSLLNHNIEQIAIIKSHSGEKLHLLFRKHIRTYVRRY